MTDAEKVEGSLSRLPIFPLPGAVLLPHALAPLHVFEPRYRKMTRDALDTNQVLALAHLRPLSLRSGEEPPRIHPVVGAGLMGQVEALPDGRFNLVLKGILRARVIEELHTAEPYRLVRAVVMRDEGGSDRASRQDGEALQRLLLALCAARPGNGAQALAQLLARATGPGELADLVGAALIEDAPQRQALLEAVDVRERLALVNETVAALLAQVGPRGPSRSQLN
jgi:Lon protease-like protein